MVVVGSWLSSRLEIADAYRPGWESVLVETGRTSCYPAEVRSARKGDAASTSSSGKVLVTMPRADGFNNQRISFYEGLAASFQRNAKVVLPPVIDNVGYDHPNNGVFAWSHFFDVDHLRASGVEVAMPDEVPQLCSEGVVMVQPHLFGTAGPMMMQVYTRKFGVNMTHETQEEDPLDRCVTRLPKVDMGAEYSDYCAHGQGYTLAGAKEGSSFARAWGAIIPNAFMRETAHRVLNALPPRFNAVQLRRGDYEDHCHKNYAEDLEGCFPTADQVLARIEQLPDPTLPIWVLTNNHAWSQQVLGKRMIDATAVFANANLPANWWGNSTDQVMLLEQIIAANAERFIGNRYSSLSNTVRNMRFECSPDEPAMFWSDKCGAH